jgi:hypothetical protein
MGAEPWFAARWRRSDLFCLDLGLVAGFIGGALMVGGLWWLS